MRHELGRLMEAMSDRLRVKILQRTGQVGMCYVDNRMAYEWRMFERKWPLLARLVFLVRFGPRVALGWFSAMSKAE